MRVTLIHNPNAGEGKPTRDELLALLREHGYDPAYRSTRQRDWDEALGDPGEMVIVAGGDGTVAKVARRLMGRDVPIALLPLGTANNIATSLGAAMFADVQVARWGSAPARPFDIGIAVGGGDGRERPFLESLGWGMFADVLRRDEEQPKQAGKSGASVASRWSGIEDARGQVRAVLRETRPRHVRVEIDEVDCSGEYLLVEVMNTPRLGPGLQLAGGADSGDGLFDVVFAGEADREQLESYLSQSPSAGANAPQLTRQRARRVVIDSAETDLHIDDQWWQRRPTGDSDDAGSVPIRAWLKPDAVRFLAG